MTAMTLRLTDTEYEQLRRAAYNLRMSQHAVVKQALNKWLKDVEPIIKSTEQLEKAHPNG